MSKQDALTLVTPVIAGKHDELDNKLMKIREDHTAGVFKEFEKIDTLHYARFVLLEDKLSNAKTNLVFSSDYDGEEEAHLLTISTLCADLIDQLYSCCEGYPEVNKRNPESREKYLRQWSNKEAAFYVGAPGRSLIQIKQENALRDYIWNFLNNNKWDGMTARAAHQKVKDYVFQNKDFNWAKEKISIPKLKWWNFALVIIIAIVFFPLTILFAAVATIWLLVLHFKYEKKDKTLGLTPSQLNQKFLENLEEYEDLKNQNHLHRSFP